MRGFKQGGRFFRLFSAYPHSCIIHSAANQTAIFSLNGVNKMTTQIQLLTVKQVANFLGLSPKNLNNKRSQSIGFKLPFIKLGGAIRYRLRLSSK